MRAGRAGVLVAHELRLQARHGILAATAVTTTVWVVILRLLPPAARGTGLELVTFAQVAVLGFTFAGALVLLERAEGADTALAVTPAPLRLRLAARVMAFALVACVATGVLAGAAGWPPTVGPAFVVGTLSVSVVMLLAGLASVAPYASITRWMIPSVVPLLILALPLLSYVGAPAWVLAALPSGGPLALLRGDEGGVVLALAGAATAAWVVVLAVVAGRRTARHLGGP